jgi:DNA-binding winged helix-turn-helix (wHTH) protein
MSLRIGKWQLNPASGEVTDGTDTRRLTPKSTAVLCALAARPGELVTKEQLLAIVWRDTVVSDSALTSCIRDLREVLDDDAKSPRYIETFYRRGYRCVAAVAAMPNNIERRRPPEAYLLPVLEALERLPQRLLRELTHAVGILAARTPSTDR